MKSILIFLLSFTAAALCAQTPEMNVPEDVTGREVLVSILSRNKAVRTAAESLRATAAANRADLSMPDPEAEVAYLLGTPHDVPNRTNVSISQALDWGLLNGERRRWAETADNSAAAAYNALVRNVMDEALQGIVDAVYYNKVCSELQRREATADSILALCERKYAYGRLNLIELNKARLNASVSRAERTRAESERAAAVAVLTRLNGGETVTLKDTVYPIETAALTKWREWEAAAGTNSAVRAAEADVATSEAALRVARLDRLPRLSVGFQGEYIKQNNYSGLAVGVSLPLWQGWKKKVKAKEAEITVRTLETEDVKQQQLSTFRQQYDVAQSLAATADKLRADLDQTSNGYLLRRAVEEGQLSILDYLMEISFFYTARTALLDAERDAARARAKLWTLTM